MLAVSSVINTAFSVMLLNFLTIASVSLYVTAFVQVIKQTIMTSVYGVTRYGARAQIENQLRHNIDNFPPELVFDARSYLAEKTFECLYIMFTTNKAIQVLAHTYLLV